LYDDITSSTSTLRIDGDSSSDPGRVERVIISNCARDESRMINAPLGADMWESMDVKIMNNETRDNALMLNFPAEFDIVSKLLDRQDANAKRNRQERKEIREFEERKQIREIEEQRQIRNMQSRRTG
jgi:hypothetical protein